METRERTKALLAQMGRGAYEREEVIALSLLTAVAGESIFLLGLPGVGKSMVARRLKMAFREGRSFEYLMSRFSTPDEIFGPVSISKLKDNDTYERAIDGYLPTADVVFLDEIWKAGPAIQNSLLTVLNEKIFRNGQTDLRLPLKAVISASNELPAEDEGLEALWDRFLVRYIVKPINDKALFLSLLCGTPEECVIDETLKLSGAELASMKKQIAEVMVPETIAETIFSIRKTLIDEKKKVGGNVDVTKSDLVEPPYVSDRRWRKIMNVLKTSAFLNGRIGVDYSDCLLMNHMLWDKDEQVDSVRKLVSDAIVENMRQNEKYGIVGRLQENSFSKPVGEPICPDGIHYVFIVGEEEMFIHKEDYRSLSVTRDMHGIMTDDNILHITDELTSLLVRKTKSGLSVNSYSYPLKRDSTLMSGSVGDMVHGVNGIIEDMESHLKNQIDDNLFLPPYNLLPSLRNAFSKTKDKILRRGY